MFSFHYLHILQLFSERCIVFGYCRDLWLHGSNPCLQVLVRLFIVEVVVFELLQLQWMVGSRLGKSRSIKRGGAKPCFWFLVHRLQLPGKLILEDEEDICKCFHFHFSVPIEHLWLNSWISWDRELQVKLKANTTIIGKQALKLTFQSPISLFSPSIHCTGHLRQVLWFYFPWQQWSSLAWSRAAGVPPIHGRNGSTSHFPAASSKQKSPGTDRNGIVLL